MPIIELDRQFIEWRKDEKTDPEMLALWHWLGGKMGWHDLLLRQRVILLAEAGSGKSEELKDKARQLSAENKFAFYATVEDVANDGLKNATLEDTKFSEWQDSEEVAWFFIDSVDEAKLSGIKLDKVFRNIAKDIKNAEARARLVISGRYTDWEFVRDLERLEHWLPIPSTSDALPLPSPNEAIIKTLRQTKSQDTQEPPEKPLVVLMRGLDSVRIRRFAEGKSLERIDDFMVALEHSNLLKMARRPLDLQWLIQYWHLEGRFGPYAKMLERSLKEHLREADPQRARCDNLDDDLAFRALERIGAALVFGQHRTITIPDSGIDVITKANSLDLSDILDDCRAEDRATLLNRPVFDPATFGRVRLHNDNEGEVSSFLAALWLKRRREENCPIQVILNLLFTTTYGIQIIRPSLRQTAAWLALWDEDVARYILAYDPILLLSAGDPSSLPIAIRRAALTKIVEQIISDGVDYPNLDQENLRRFTTPDIADHVRSLWMAHHENPEVRKLLLQMIWLGRLSSCSDIVINAVFSTYNDRKTQVFGGRALIAIADNATRTRYAAYICANCETLPETVIQEAIEDLCPEFLPVNDLLIILNHDSEFKLYLPSLADNLSCAADLEILLAGVITMLGDESDEEDSLDTPIERNYLPFLLTVAHRLLETYPIDQAPISVIDAALRMGESRRHIRNSKETTYDVAALLQKSPHRRRLAFWRAAECLRNSKRLYNHPLTNVTQMYMAGWPPGLQIEDVSWLLEDAPMRTPNNERLLAINAALDIWQQNGKPADILQKIEAVTGSDSEMTSAVTQRTQPFSQSSEYETSQRKLDKIHQRNRLEQEAADRSWCEFAERLRSNPEQLKNIAPPTQDSFDVDLYNIWNLLNATDGKTGHYYAINDLSALEPMLGEAVVTQAKAAFINFWRVWLPHLHSTCASGEHNKVYIGDCIGIVGISLEAKINRNWATLLTDDEARLATGYATLELNGFPVWFTDLAVQKPNAVMETLNHEILHDLDRNHSTARHGILEDIARADSIVVNLMAPPLLQMLIQRPNMQMEALRPLLEVLRRGCYNEQHQFVEIAINRFESTSENGIRVSYLAPIFSIDPSRAITSLLRVLGTMTPVEQRGLVETALSQVFRDRSFEQSIDPFTFPFDCLVELITMAYRIIRVDDDRVHRSGVVYTPEARDDAENARNTLFNTLVKTPGRATFDTLLRFAEEAILPIPSQRLKDLALERAATDSESDPWPASEARQFEFEFDSAPQTPAGLLKTAVNRLAEIQHLLHNGDFNQASTLALLPDENAVQNWMAERLRNIQKRAYSVEREPHVAAEKEPDIRLRAKATDASIPIEIKVAESWSLTELDAALETQLCGQYLRERSARHGILLLIHQKARPRGWKDTETPSIYLSFNEVVNRLRNRATQIAGRSPDAPQPEIVVIDVSCTEDKKTTTKKSKQSKQSSAKATSSVEP